MLEALLYDVILYGTTLISFVAQLFCIVLCHITSIAFAGHSV